jgi:hypothetical protein
MGPANLMALGILALTLAHRQLFFVIAVLSLGAGGLAASWLFIPPLFWGIGALSLGVITPVSMYLYIARWRERTVAVRQNNSVGLIKVVFQNLRLVLRLLIYVAIFTKSVDQLAGLAPLDGGLNRWVFLGVIAYCCTAAIFFPRVWPSLYNAGLVSTPAPRDIVRFAWESRPSSGSV